MKRYELMADKKKKSNYSTPVIFFVTLIISLVVFGLIAYFILDFVVFNDKAAIKPKTDVLWYTPDKSDNQTVLIIGQNGGELEYICIMYYNVCQKSIVFIPVPLNSSAQVNTTKGKLSDFYSQSNPKQLCKAVENMFDIPVQRYIQMTPEMLTSFTNQMGHINFELLCDLHCKNTSTNEITDLKRSDESRMFTGADLRKIMIYPDYPDGIINNMYYQGLIPSELLNNFFSHSDDAMTCLDNMYKSIIKDSDTNITEYDFYSKKNSIKYILENTKKPAIYILPEGEQTSKGIYNLSQEFKSSVKSCIINN